MQVTFNKRSILPTVQVTEKGTYFNTTIFSPVRYSLRAESAVMPKEQIESILKDCAENAQEVEIEFTESNGKFGPQIQVFSVKPIPKPMPQAIKTA